MRRHMRAARVGSHFRLPSPSSILAVLVLTHLAAVDVPTAVAAPPPACPSAIYLADVDPLIDGNLGEAERAITVQGRTASIGIACSGGKVTSRGRKDGTTRIVARWQSCSGLTGRVRLVATTDASCTALTEAKLTAKQFRKIFTATALGTLPTYAVDPAVVPSRPTVPDEPARALVAIEDDFGNHAEFVEDEILVTTDDNRELAAILKRWGGTVSETWDPKETGFELPRRSLVRIDRTRADEHGLAAAMRAIDAGISGSFRASSESALRLLTIAATEAAAGRGVGIDVFFQSDGVLEGSTREAPTGSWLGANAYTPDAAMWSYMSSSGQSIGVARAWQALAFSGRLYAPDLAVPLAILDGGFELAGTVDYPLLASASFHKNTAALGTPNAMSCGGGCPWHGAAVADAAMATADDGVGGAGPGSSVARAILIKLNGSASKADQAVLLAVKSGARIINMSFGANQPRGVVDLGNKALESATREARRKGVLVFASAGNDGRFLDGRSCFVTICSENSWQTPCESDGVICVGGLAPDTTARDPNTNYGRTDGGGGNTVDLFAPFSVYVGGNPDAPANNANVASGTSFASPFAAGVAALIWGANPALSADDVESILRQTARQGGAGVIGIVDAYAGVIAALGYTPTVPTLPQERLTKILPVAANVFPVDTGIDVTIGDPLLISASGQWSTTGFPPFGPDGLGNSSGFINEVYPPADRGALIGFVQTGPSALNRTFFTVGSLRIGTSPATGRLYLAMNDVEGHHGHNQGAVVASVSFAGSSFVTTTVPANLTWVDTGIVAPVDTPYNIFASGSWSNAGPPSVGPAGFVGYQLPGTILPSADLASLIGLNANQMFPVGPRRSESFRGPSTLSLGINDVPGTYGDNQGSVSATISYGWVVN